MSRPGGSRIEFRYDRAGRKIATLTPLGRETLFERDENGQVIGQVTPDGQRWTMERDALGNTVRIEGPEHQRWQITRNKRGQQLEITGPEGTTAFAYDDERLPDRPTTVTDAVGATHQREWNALGQVTAEIDCSQQRTAYDYDRHGFLASVTNALGETTRTQHDELERRIATQQPDGTITMTRRAGWSSWKARKASASSSSLTITAARCSASRPTAAINIPPMTTSAV